MSSKARAVVVDKAGKVRFAIDGALFDMGKMVYERAKNPIVFVSNDVTDIVVAHKVFFLLFFFLCF